MPLGEKNFFNVRKKVPVATKAEGGGLKALMAAPLRKELFFAASLIKDVLSLIKYKHIITVVIGNVKS